MNYHGRWAQGQGGGDMPWQDQTSRYPQQAQSSSSTHPASLTMRTQGQSPDRYDLSKSAGYPASVTRRVPRFGHSLCSSPIETPQGLTQWPPQGYSHESVLDPAEAQNLICNGASVFNGFVDEIPNVPDLCRFFAMSQSEHNRSADRADLQHEAFEDISLDLAGSGTTSDPWLSLEQPSMSSCFGKFPGTTTLNYWVGKSGCLEIPMQCKTQVCPKTIKLLQILDRLRDLENGIEKDDETSYKYLYSNLIHDPDKATGQHYGMEKQIADLITVLGHPDWINFSLAKNQVVAKFFETSDLLRKQQFFHQLLLSTELYLRIHSEAHTEKAKRKLLRQLPPKISWDLAVAQRWSVNMSISRIQTSSKKSTFSFDLRSKKRQKEALRVFASILKWPNMSELNYVLDERDKNEKAVEDRSADAMSWFTGVILPGPTLPWLIMNTVIDCDRDTGESLKYLTHMHQNTGFQYRANTYWSHECIVGKVLGAARGVKQVAGWVGPCNYSPDLKRTECVRVRQLETVEPKLAQKVLEDMAYLTEPLGPEDCGYPVDDYEFIVPDTIDVTDAIRVEKLSFQLVSDQKLSSRLGAGAPLLFDSAIIFACGGESWPMRLKYNVSFITAYSCHRGPHVLFYDYTYRIIKVDGGLVDIVDWVDQSREDPTEPSRRSYSTSLSQDERAITTSNTYPIVTKVLVIEAFGVSDNEVFARAWCAHWGLSALVANVQETCVACAIREAYGACLSVVILTEGGKNEDRNE